MESNEHHIASPRVSKPLKSLTLPIFPEHKLTLVIIIFVLSTSPILSTFSFIL
jgi:hypothetical protein